jgi:hypothetical protein
MINILIGKVMDFSKLRIRCELSKFAFNPAEGRNTDIFLGIFHEKGMKSFWAQSTYHKRSEGC